MKKTLIILSSFLFYSTIVFSQTDSIFLSYSKKTKYYVLHINDTLSFSFKKHKTRQNSFNKSIDTLNYYNGSISDTLNFNICNAKMTLINMYYAHESIIVEINYPEYFIRFFKQRHGGFIIEKLYSDNIFEKTKYDKKSRIKSFAYGTLYNNRFNIYEYDFYYHNGNIRYLFIKTAPYEYGLINYKKKKQGQIKSNKWGTNAFDEYN